MGHAKSAFIDTVSSKNKHKVPLSYSRAGKSARSLNGHRDDEL